MSTKAIRELLDDVDGLLSDDDVTLEERIRAARVEVEAIEKAARQWYAQETQGLVLQSDALAPLERIALGTRRGDVAKRTEDV